MGNDDVMFAKSCQTIQFTFCCVTNPQTFSVIRPNDFTKVNN